MKQYDLIIITSYTFPVGLASTNRIMSYAKEIAKSRKVLVLSYAQTSYSPNECAILYGEKDNVKYRYLRPCDPLHKNVLTKIFYRFYTYTNFYFSLLIRYKAKSYLSYFHDASYTKGLSLISKIKGVKIYKDITETFESYFGSDEARETQKQLQKLFDGLVVMTNEIGQYFKDVNKNFFVLPMGVDVSRFEGISNNTEKYFFYCSGGVLERDGLLDSLKAFIMFSNNHTDYTFRIATPINAEDSYHQQVMELINSCDRIEYLGKISSPEIPRQICNSTGLLVTPHHDYVTKGFPTKLGEYLASGRPVVCTSIDSLKENVDEGCTYMVEPNNPKEIAKALEDIVTNPQNANEVGQKGKAFVIRKYTVAPYLHHLLSFLNLD